MNQIDLKGRAAAVTGGASGIGLATCQRFAASGARVAVWDVNPDAAAQAVATLAPNPAGPHLAVGVDVASEASVAEATRRTIDAFGRCDIMVCSAGVAGMNAPVVDYPVAEWQRVLDVCLNGVFLCNRAVMPVMTQNGYGRIVNVSSVAGKEGNPTASAYSAAKAGVIGFTKSLAKETAKGDIRVNAITPTTIATPILAQVSQAHIDYMLSKIPVGRVGQPDEVAAMIAWLCSEECSFSTGAVFDLSGGRTTY